MKDVVVIIPAYNEEESLSRLLPEIRAAVPEYDIIVINDGSSDRTEEVAGNAGVRSISLPFNCGIGAAVQTGFRYAVEKGYSVAVQVDGDGQHDPGFIRPLVAALREGKLDVAIGSRFLEKKGFQATPLRRFGIWIFQTVNSRILGQTVTDNTSGFRAYSNRAFSFLADDYPCDYPEPEAVVTLGLKGFVIREIPVGMRERLGGESSIVNLRPVYYMTKVLLATFMNLVRALLARRRPA